MAIRVLRDPRPYLLAVMVVALTVIVPLLFMFVTMIDKVLGPQASAGWIVLWALLGVVIVGLVVELMMILGRATRLSEHEHEMESDDGHRVP
jgi:NADH:ubiquinone oxidoreductase subunit 6 (subunit J)